MKEVKAVKAVPKAKRWIACTLESGMFPHERLATLIQDDGSKRFFWVQDFRPKRELGDGESVQGATLAYTDADQDGSLYKSVGIYVPCYPADDGNGYCEVPGKSALETENDPPGEVQVPREARARMESAQNAQNEQTSKTS